MSLRRAIAFTFLASLSSLLACTTQTETKTVAPSDPTEPTAGAPEEEETPPDEPAAPDPPEKKEPAVVAKAVISGTFAEVDVTYGRAGKYIALDMKGDAGRLTAAPTTVSAAKIEIAKTTTYELLYPELGSCDKPPELTIQDGTVHVEMQRAGEPNATISGCYYLSSGVKASDGGFQARLENVTLSDGTKVDELLLDIAGPKS